MIFIDENLSAERATDPVTALKMRSPAAANCRAHRIINVDQHDTKTEAAEQGETALAAAMRAALARKAVRG